MNAFAVPAALRAVLITGATGLVGSELIEQLSSDGCSEVVGVSRRGSPTDPSIVAWDAGTEPPPAQLRRPWDVIVNAAASTRWTMDQVQATTANVTSVRALGSLASKGTHVVHLSTAYAVGLRNDAGSPNPEDYRNTYEWSKAHAERVARETFADLTVVRPPLITGRLSDGRAARFSGIYTLVRGMTVGTLPAIVAEPDAPFDAIPVDRLGRHILDLVAGHNSNCGSTTLTIAAGLKAPSVKEAIAAVTDALNKWRRLRDCRPLEPLPLISPESWNRFFWPFIKDHLSARQAMVLDLLRHFEPYLALATPLSPDYTIADVLPSLAVSTCYWADTNPRIAAHSPRPWRGSGSA